MYSPKRSFTERSEDIVYFRAKRVFKGLQGFFLQIDVTKIVVHKGHQPDAIVDLLDTDGLTRQRSAEIYFLFENADPSAVGNQSGAIVEGIRKFSDAAIVAGGGCIDVGRASHIESFMRTLVVKLANESVERGLLLKEVATGRPRRRRPVTIEEMTDAAAEGAATVAPRSRRR